jgi:hypothetical protein
MVTKGNIEEAKSNAFFADISKTTTHKFKYVHDLSILLGH